MARNVARRLQQLEMRAKQVAAVHPVHRLIFEGDPEPTDLPPGSTVHRMVFVSPLASGEELNRLVDNASETHR